jgi:YidC/Oxa1 family membrane protein insertase
LLPLRKRGNEQMKKTAELQKRLAYVQQKYKNDPEALAREKAELFKKYGTGLGGCLPNLILLPVFFALSPVLSQAIELYKAPFIGWINDLSSKDPYYILPLIIFVIFIVRALFSDANQRLSMLAVALIFGAFAANFSAGLCLYILVGVLMELVTMKKK